MQMGIKFHLVALGLLLTLGFTQSASAEQLSARDHAITALLLSDSDDSVKLGGKSVMWFGIKDQRLTDTLAEVAWRACAGKRQMDPDTLAWLGKALGSTKNTRYSGVLDGCMVSEINTRTQEHMRRARQELTEGAAETYQTGAMDLQAIRSTLLQPRTLAANQLNERFNKLQKNAPLANIYTSLGYPDEIGIGIVSANNRLNQRIWLTALKLTYKGAGEIQFFAEADATDWQLDNAVNSSGLLMSSQDGRFRTSLELIKNSNAIQLREVAEYLINRRALTNEEFESIMARDKAPLDPTDERLADSLGWLERAALEDGNPAHERTMSMSLIERGDGLQLRHTAEHWLGKDSTDGEIVKAMMDRIVAQADTKDGMLADGLAYLCKVVQKSGDTKYSDQMQEISNNAAHKTLRKYATKAASALSKGSS
ncbi:MAG: hypothetical protein V1879_01725 [Pseudomonadota bacterium]